MAVFKSRIMQSGAWIGGFRRCPVAPAVLLILSAAGILWGEGDSFHFSIVGDRTWRPNQPVYEQVWKEVGLLGPDFAITVGDTINRGRDDRTEAEWDAVRPLWEGHPFPVYFTPGNHDIWSDRSRRIYEKVTGRPPQYSFVHQNALFVVLDNSQTLELAEDQLRFLEAELRKHRDRSPKFVFFHKPYWVVPVRLRSPEFLLHKLARQHGVNYVVSGHAHQFFRFPMDGVVYLAVGSSGAGMERGTTRGEGFQEGWFYHHAWVKVDGDQVRVVIRELGAPYGEGRLFDAADWTTEGLRTNPGRPAGLRKPGVQKKSGAPGRPLLAEFVKKNLRQYSGERRRFLSGIIGPFSARVELSCGVREESPRASRKIWARGALAGIIGQLRKPGCWQLNPLAEP